MSGDPHAEIRAGGSADPDERGPGAGVAAPATQLTGTLQSASNDAFDGLKEFGNSAFDVGESGLADVLKVADAAQTGVSSALSAVTAKVTGGDPVEIPTIPTADIATGLTGTAQEAANRLLNGIQTFANEVFDVGEEGLDEALQVVDELQSEVSALLTRVRSIAAGKGLGGPAKG